MIVGENFNQYDGYEEASYDYLFKHNSGETHRQKKAARKTGQPAHRHHVKARSRPNGAKKRLLMSNFGLLNKNKIAEAANPQVADAQVDSSDMPDASALDSTPPETQVNNPQTADPGGDTAPTPDSTPPAEADAGNGSDSSYDEPAGPSKAEGRPVEKGSEAKKPVITQWIGLTCLVLTVITLGYVLHHMDKKSDEYMQRYKGAAQPNIK